ncbi:CamS family sex pheromone protein [Phocicoccus pinnipedialis]|uniref:CamS sex pheromone cAM373 n=1 Tax=Phocicoccus pinnipedialis TaxID=110845 RepID=A0A6V7R9D0_9BACL|nr:CamS family sex pheromone protein [Jeotgalicoccus pinnipedialis]MBP1940211.1 protein involved in sex pheromone biosynthesis [Jeotgalicoccus pinnipedialis]CAD2074039.1 CamS sex pheromone cAM373 precursor [Jeotgalicoccus pinnipedialis]
MKKMTGLLIASALFLTACSNTSVDVENAGKKNADQNISKQRQENVADTVTDVGGDEFYRSVIPYKLSKSRGLTSTNMVSSYNMEDFEEGLFEISKEVYSPEDYIFQEGQILSEDMTRAYLRRQFTKEEIDAMNEEELVKSGAFSNLGLNPSKQGEEDPEVIAKNTPLYLSHILEQNYLTVDEEGNTKFEGITFGLAMNSEHLYQKEQYGTTYRESINVEDAKIEGEEMARELLDRLRANKEYVDKAVVFAIYSQSKSTDIVPGQFLSYAIVKPGENEISKFIDIDEQNILLPSNNEEIPEELRSNYNAFNRDLSSYFKSYTTSVGRGHIKDGKLDRLEIEIPIEYESRGEMIGLSQYAQSLVDKYFKNTKVEVKVQDKNNVYSIITSDKDDKTSMYIME